MLSLGERRRARSEMAMEEHVEEEKKAKVEEGLENKQQIKEPVLEGI